MSGAAIERFGFVGTGAITRAIISGLLSRSPENYEIVVSPRNADAAAELASLYPSVRVAENNQAVVDATDVVFLAVRPQIAAEVIPALEFRPDHLIVSLIAATDRARLQAWIPTEADIVQAIPLPFVERREGATAIFPPHPTVSEIFGRLGTALPCSTRQEYDLLAAASATMSLYFGLMGRAVEWLQSNGLPEESARTYLAAHFDSLSKVAVRQSDIPLHELASEYATKGGLNEQVWMDFDQHGGTQALRQALDRVHQRITKPS